MNINKKIIIDKDLIDEKIRKILVELCNVIYNSKYMANHKL